MLFFPKSISLDRSDLPPEKLAEMSDPHHHQTAGYGDRAMHCARAIVQAHEGRTSAMDRPEGGAIFHLLMPCFDAMGDAPGGKSVGDRSRR
jgi:K+-sensing histidine kinase KdpD